MREIKFRAWDKNKNEIREVTSINWYDEYIWVDETPMSGDKLPIESTPLMQYTGLKDKNGKEIYEGDIVTHNIYTKQSGRNEQSKPKIVFWDKEKCGFETNERESYSAGMFYSEYTVIGNIHQNPELLK